MIVKMLKLTLLCVEHDRASTLDALRGLGVVHVQPVVTPAGAGLEQARAKAAALQRVLDAVPAAVSDGAVPAPSGRKPEDVAEEVSRLLEERKTARDQMEALQAECARVEPLGDFDPAGVEALAEKGVTLKLFKVSAKNPPAFPENTGAEQLSVRKNDAYWALFAQNDFTWAGAEEIRPPAQSCAAMQSEMARLTAAEASIDGSLRAMAADRPALEILLRQAEAAVRLEEVRSGMGQENVVAWLQGFIPEAEVDRVRAAAAGNGWGLVVEEPGPQDDVPVALTPPRWASPIQAVFDGINILPGYHEADVSAVFMLFFSLFFAMIIGDAGYGAIFLAATLWFRKKMPSAARNLLLVTSLATIVWGLVSGSVFGISHDLLAKAGLDKLWIPYLTDEARSAQNIMGMCFLIGAIQISIGHLWNAVDLIRQKSLKTLEQIGWTLTTWYMFFLADNMIIGGNMVEYIGRPAALTPFTGSPLDWAAVVGCVLILLFMMKPSEIKDGWFNLALFPLNIISNFTDVVSYVRLYAVGAAGFAVAAAFNTMIFGGEVTLISGLIGAVLAFAAHTLNILLCVMGVLVHGIRLNTLEFSNHKGISWSGSPYRPFAKPESPATI